MQQMPDIHKIDSKTKILRKGQYTTVGDSYVWATRQKTDRDKLNIVV